MEIEKKQTHTLPTDGNISGRTFGNEELQNLQAALCSGKLNCTKGTWVNDFQKKFQKYYNVPFARCVTSGTAAIHTAIAAINPEPGDEVITTALTDMGAITPILYQTAVPIFADINWQTYNVTAETIAPHLSKRTKAIIVTHLFGNPCEMGPILDLAKQHRIPIIEDASQAYLATYKNQLVGKIGDIGCFSLQQGKHITTGEGGIIISTNADYARRADLFVDKGWGYDDQFPDHEFLALNYRMTELQGAVACAQFEKIEEIVSERILRAKQLTEMIAMIEGISSPQVSEGSRHVYWKYCLDIDPKIIHGGVEAFSKSLKEQYGIYSAPRYIKKPAFLCKIFREKATFGSSGFPFSGPHRKGLPPIEYRIEDYPGTMRALERICVLPWNEKYTEEDVAFIGHAIKETASNLKNDAN